MSASALIELRERAGRDRVSVTADWYRTTIRGLLVPSRRSADLPLVLSPWMLEDQDVRGGPVISRVFQVADTMFSGEVDAFVLLHSGTVASALSVADDVAIEAGYEVRDPVEISADTGETGTLVLTGHVAVRRLVLPAGW